MFVLRRGRPSGGVGELVIKDYVFNRCPWVEPLFFLFGSGRLVGWAIRPKAWVVSVSVHSNLPIHCVAIPSITTPRHRTSRSSVSLSSCAYPLCLYRGWEEINTRTVQVDQ